jgi:hypothetical protein
MIGAIVYILCGLSSLLCTVLLFKHYARTRLRLLFWSASAFLCFTLTNIILFIDVVLVPEIDLSLLRNCINLSGVMILLYGLIHNES